ncbi:MAG TPA: benzene 1,2-dioxygenase [Alphaproteobacteria bacterium]|jgi:3-phenylpropionate/cinnamic acid dioxygenase small subunit|nr:benzene 1,2-dioxygenase [Alphaproteobacteria bacterium]HAM47440.1 benzene 1,2-dioxygenase [Alphaproteobacteria bacterium]HBA42263.1 benzene 1,2-dioxygenase [Alphaproteobacteria bacterium]HBC55320.1 benzene 1,2-dioxygenase [Alphaproteobacteria bacterium]HBF97638.1 benzene 1,2-dioxygenase [Alphaproteobacteria bacterium]
MSQAATRTSAPQTITPELQQELEQFLYAEALMLDERRYRDWYAHLADDLHYRMPLRMNRTAREMDREFSQPDESCLFDETKASIHTRLKRLETGMAWAEEPPSRTRHMITNVRIEATDDPAAYIVHSYFHLYRSRLERQVDQLVGARSDLIRRADTPCGWQIQRRDIILDQSTVLANNLSMFF